MATRKAADEDVETTTDGEHGGQRVGGRSWSRSTPYVPDAQTPANTDSVVDVTSDFRSEVENGEHGRDPYDPSNIAISKLLG